MFVSRELIEKEIREAEKILLKPGAFLRLAGGGKYQYEAIKPGDWAQYESRGIREESFKLMLKRGSLRELNATRWAMTNALEKTKES